MYETLTIERNNMQLMQAVFAWTLEQVGQHWEAVKSWIFLNCCKW